MEGEWLHASTKCSGLFSFRFHIVSGTLKCDWMPFRLPPEVTVACGKNICLLQGLQVCGLSGQQQFATLGDSTGFPP